MSCICLGRAGRSAEVDSTVSSHATLLANALAVDRNRKAGIHVFIELLGKIVVCRYIERAVLTFRSFPVQATNEHFSAGGKSYQQTLS